MKCTLSSGSSKGSLTRCGWCALTAPPAISFASTRRKSMWHYALSVPRRDSSVRPKGADYQWGEDPLEQLLVRFDSWRAVRSGNGSGWSLATKSTFGGRATLQAVTRVKLEQASKVTMWTPTRQMSGEGRLDWEEPGAGERCHYNQHAPIQSTGVVSTACKEGNLASVG